MILSMTTCNYWTGCDTGLIAVHSPVTLIAHHTIIVIMDVSVQTIFTIIITCYDMRGEWDNNKRSVNEPSRLVIVRSICQYSQFWI